MSARPDPPLSTDSPEELAAHVPEHSSDWLLYLRNVNAYMSALEREHASLTEERVALRNTIQQREAVIDYQETNLQTAQQKITQLEIEKHQLAATAAPAVHVTPSAPARTEPLVDLSIDPATRTSVPTPATSSGSAQLSEKLPDPKEFDGARGDLRRFTQQVYAKMTTNADRFPTAPARLTYVAGRLTGRAYELILPKTNYGVPQFVDYPELLQYLEGAFGDPDRIQNAQNKLYTLKQRNQDFSVYFSEFQRLALEGEMPDNALTPLLFQGISRELQDMLLHNPSPSRDFHKYAQHLQGLDNRYRQHQQQVSRNRNPPTTQPATPKTVPSQPRTTTATTTYARPATPTSPGDPMDLSSQRRNGGRRERRECYRCGSSSHFVANCPEPDQRQSKLHSFRPTSPPRSLSSRSPPRYVAPSPTRGRSTSPDQNSLNGASLR